MNEALYNELFEKLFESKIFSEREIGLLKNMMLYVNNEPQGLPGHNIMVISAKLTNILLIMQVNISGVIDVLKNILNTVRIAYVHSYAEAHNGSSEDIKALDSMLCDLFEDIERMFSNKIQELKNE